MGIESDDDLLFFLEVSDFAVTATYTPAGGDEVEVVGIFDAPRASRNASDLLGVVSPAPQFMCRTSDVAGAEDGDEITIQSTDYLVRVVLTDGLGMTTMTLEAV
jgi:hypothetical protein